LPLSNLVIPQDDMTAKILGPDGLPQVALFLPAVSPFFAGYIGRQHYMSRGHIVPSRISPSLENGIAGLNWMNKDEGYFYYQHNLFSAGHVNLDDKKKKKSIKEYMIYNRDRKNTFVLGDSGGYQIGKGVWKADWKNPNCPAAATKRKQVLEWMDHHMDYGIILDIPAWVRKTQKGIEASGISTFDEAIQATSINNEYFMRHRTGECKFLNVMQGGNHKESEDWYQKMKKFCDPKQYETPFNGWACGSQIACDPHLTLKRLITARFDGLLEPGIHDWIHILGQSDFEWVLILSDLQRSIRKYHNPKMTVSYDCAGPFIAGAHGLLYYDHIRKNKGYWSFPMKRGFNNKKYATDTRSIKDAVLQDNIYESWVDSPITQRLKMNDFCHLGPTDLNRLGKIGTTSMDTFSYALLIAHNVWMHIETVQEANRQYANGNFPAVMSTVTTRKKAVIFDRAYCSDIIDDIWATSDYGKAMKLIDHYSEYWMQFRGVRGNVGRYTKNSTTAFNHIFQEV
jgi:hypothetical protein